MNTQMFLLSKKTLWLSDGSMGFGQESDIAFSEGIIVLRSCTFNLCSILPGACCCQNKRGARVCVCCTKLLDKALLAQPESCAECSSLAGCELCALFPGDVIYGRVMVDPVQNLGDSFYCSIEKVFLCTGADGYVPKYNPSNTEYGCLADSPSLLYRFKIVVSALILGGCI